MTCTLSLAERYTLLKFIPTVGSIEQAIACQGLRSRLEPNEDEREKAGIRVRPGVITWDPKKDFGRKFTLSDMEVQVLYLGARLLSSGGQFPTDPDAVRLYHALEKASTGTSKKK